MHAAIHKLNLPLRAKKPRENGLTLAIDGGAPVSYFKDVVESHGEVIDLVKFGWGTIVVTEHVSQKLSKLKAEGIEFFFGGTLFEKFYVNKALDDYLEYCRYHEACAVEVSSGSTSIPSAEIRDAIERCREAGFLVFCEIGSKDGEKSDAMIAEDWAKGVEVAYRAGAHFIVLEARESGSYGICSRDGELRLDIIEASTAAGAPIEQLIFEAPRRAQQAYLIRRFGPNVNLANINFNELISLETLRCGLRFETFDMQTSAIG
jgi:phosphosulfolactate synthase